MRIDVSWRKIFSLFFGYIILYFSYLQRKVRVAAIKTPDKNNSEQAVYVDCNLLCDLPVHPAETAKRRITDDRNCWRRATVVLAKMFARDPNYLVTGT